jgi:hypothetical protein
MAEPKDETNYKTLPPLIISIIKADKIYGYLRLELQLATKDGHSIEYLKPLYPILVDAYTTKLYSLIGDRWIPDHPLPQGNCMKFWISKKKEKTHKFYKMFIIPLKFSIKT